MGRAAGTALVTALVAALAVVATASPAAAEPGNPERPAAGPGTEPEADQRPPRYRAVAPPSRRRGSTVARIVVASRGRLALKKPGRSVAISPQTSWSRHGQSLLVLRSARYRGVDWVKLHLAERPNGSAAWVRRDRVVLSRNPYWVRVGLGSRRVSVLRRGRTLRRFRAVIGKPATPTPVGLSAIYERNRQPDPDAFLGPWALSITFHSDVIRDFGGGPGRVAIHGRGGASFRDPLGSASSHGCIRVNSLHIRWMARRLPVGTPVEIVR